MSATAIFGQDIRAVLFDLDGTLADTAPDLALALNHVRATLQCRPIPIELARPYTSSGARGLLAIGLGIVPGHPEFETLKNRFLDAYEQRICVHSALYDGMAHLLSELERRQIHWGIVTNKAARFTLPLLEKLGITPRAACIVSGDTAARPKPYPDPLLHASATLNIPAAHCLYVGDDLRDVQAARAAGMLVAAAAYGYIGVGTQPNDWQADAVIAAPLDLLHLLRE